MISSGWQRFTRGVPGAGAPMVQQTLVDHFKGMLSYGRRGTTDVVQGATELRKPLSPTSSPYMRWADETDRAFRESAFVRSLQNGDSPETAAKIARETFLDYGSMPSWTRQGFLKSALYLSFTYVSSAELLRALTTAEGALRVSAMANYHRNLSRAMGTYTFAGDQTMQYVWMQPFEDESGFNTYLRSPYMSNLTTLANVVGFGLEAGSGGGENLASRAIEGGADFFYLPMIDFARSLDAEYKRSVPAKQLLQMQEGLYDKQFWSLNPATFIRAIQSNGQPTAYWFDRYDIEVKPLQLRNPNSPTFGGQQFRFRSKEGYNRYLFDNLIVANVGITRGFNDYIFAYYLMNPDKLPSNVKLGATGPEYIDALNYLFLRERGAKLPKELAIEYRALQESLRRTKEATKKYEK